MSKEYKRLSTTDFTGRRRSSFKPKNLVRIYQPTYQLNPRKHFNVEVVEKLLRRIVDCELAEVEYSEKVVPELCLSLAETIRNAVKEENYDSRGISCVLSLLLVLQEEVLTCQQ
ncbi:uncharacterized protein LOC115447577 isoform X3 [Manduca sexta]|uniref:uncharacterized protein LOC115447577 isoform X3 n=1 Tax=Manduca sexta TaxID=7130 RepID=UPI00189052A8|nr:uncharacterized protein LOC115447577 isoform X3 [Manduca sexta]